MFLLLFEDLTVPLCGFYGIDRTKILAKKIRPYFSKPVYHLPLLISRIHKTSTYISLSKGPFPLQALLFSSYSQLLPS